jgi:hypothetical protein
VRVTDHMRIIGTFVTRVKVHGSGIQTLSGRAVGASPHPIRPRVHARDLSGVAAVPPGASSRRAPR